MNREKLFKLIVANLKKQGAKRIAVFGSYARNKQKKSSDIDLIVDFYKTKSLLELVGIEQDLAKATGKKVDLLTKDSISPYLIDKIKHEMVKIY